MPSALIREHSSCLGLHPRTAQGLNDLRPGPYVLARSRHGTQPGLVCMVLRTSSFDKQTPVCSVPVITPHAAAEASYPLRLYRKRKNATAGLVRPHSGIYAKRPQGIPRGLLYQACFSSSISRLCWRMIERRNATSSSSSSTRLFGASVSIMVC